MRIALSTRAFGPEPRMVVPSEHPGFGPRWDRGVELKFDEPLSAGSLKKLDMVQEHKSDLVTDIGTDDFVESQEVKEVAHDDVSEDGREVMVPPHRGGDKGGCHHRSAVRKRGPRSNEGRRSR